MSDLPFVARVEARDSHVALKVKDLEASVRFYHDVVGLPILRKFGSPENPRAVFVSGIQLVRGSAEPGPNPYGIFDHVGVAVENIVEACAHLDAAGFKADTPLNKRSFPELNDRELLSAYYRDPDGNRVELVHWL